LEKFRREGPRLRYNVWFFSAKKNEGRCRRWRWKERGERCYVPERKV